ncbi:hypothetical protein Tco_0800402 [Tanacetum coccineum]|uniref:Uncharacterized protein n=1 Tax=Tanacetum coccineum TaxID=301880 RepID=A0ABQ4ZT07_9ASTR
MAPLPHHDLRHPWLRYQVNGYDEGIIHSYEQRLKTIWGNRVHVLDFDGLIDGMRQTLGDRLSMVYVGDDGQALMSDTEIGLHSKEEMAEAWVPPGPERQQAVAASAPGAVEDAPTADEGAQAVPAPIQAPQSSPPAPQNWTMSQRIKRLEEEVHKMRQSVLMDASSRAYQAFDSTLVGSSRLSYERRVRPKTDDACTSTAPHTNDQPNS